MIIRARHYEDAVMRLVQNPTVQDMAVEIKSVDKIRHFLHEDGSPRCEFMMAANNEFSRRGGDAEGSYHIGAIAEAILKLLRCGK